MARAKLSDAPIWFLDEPTSAVDAETEERILQRFADEAQHRMVILTSHRLSLLRLAATITVLDEGHVVEQGS